MRRSFQKRHRVMAISHRSEAEMDADQEDEVEEVISEDTNIPF